jgi:hypothetical protein
VRAAFSESGSPTEWIQRLIDEFGISKDDGEIFACAWFAGRYAGVSDVFKVVQMEMDKLEREKTEKDKAEKENEELPISGYV